jgi:hypothetical protein
VLVADMSAISEFQEWFKGNWDYYNDRKFDRAPAKSAWMHQQKIIDSLEERLIRSGFVRCDLPACNCGSWHQRYGLPDRMREIREALTEAGHPPCNENGNLIPNALGDLIRERDYLLAEQAAWRKFTSEAESTLAAADKKITELVHENAKLQIDSWQDGTHPKIEDQQ